MAGAGPLNHLYGFCGADEALTNYETGKDNWVATLIYKAGSRDELISRCDKLSCDLSRVCGSEITLID